MRLLCAGDSALLVELDDLAQALALYRALQQRPIAGTEELIPAARTVLVRYRPAAIGRSALSAELVERGKTASPLIAADSATTRRVEIPVHYDGEDLPEVAERMGVSIAEVIACHTGQPWQAAFAGFAPGFVYLAGGHPSLRLPRRKTPRTRVPAGSVALADNLSAVYPRASPGGWQLIGITELAMWDLQRAEPAWVQPGFRVQFIDAGRAGVIVSLPAQAGSKRQSGLPAADPLPGPPAIELVDAGLQTLVQDAGRRGMAGLGVSPSGALDQAAMRRANRLVGNPVHTPVLENLLGRMRLRSHGRTTLALAGAEVALTLQAVGGRQWPLAGHQAVALDDGDELVVGAASAGVRCYVAVRGGWSVAPVLGSAASDTLAHIGPPALTAGAWIAAGRAVAAGELRATQEAELAPPALPSPGATVTLDVVPGPRTDWFTAEALALLQSQNWRVTPQSNRVGMRLEGEQPLARSRHDELPSEGTVTGAIQVPASGQPVLFLADHPTTGGYPVIASVASHHLDLAAQIAVGCFVRLHVVEPACEAPQQEPAP